MIAWKNLSELKAYSRLKALKGKVNLQEAMAGESGAKRVAEYAVPMGGHLTYHYAAKQVDDEVLDALQALADEAAAAAAAARRRKRIPATPRAPAPSRPACPPPAARARTSSSAA